MLQRNLKYKVSQKDLLKAAEKNQHHNAGFDKLNNNKGFEKGEGGIEQISRDITGDSLSYKGHKPASEPQWSSSYYVDHAQQIRANFKLHADNIIAGHSQHPMSVVYNILKYSYEMGNDAIVLQPTTRYCNIYDEKREIFLEWYGDNFPIGDPIDGMSKIIGKLPGPVRAVFKLEQRDGKWGYALQFIETDNEDIKNMLIGMPMSNAALQLKYCSTPSAAISSSAAAAAAAVTVSTSSAAASSAATPVPAAVPTAVPALSSETLAQEKEEVRRLLDEIKKSIDLIITNTQEKIRSPKQEILHAEVTKILNASLRITLIATNKTGEQDASLDEIMTHIESLFPGKHELYNQHAYSVLAAICGISSNEHAYSVTNTTSGIFLKKPDLEENRTLTSYYTTKLNITFNNITNYQNALSNLQNGIKQSKDESINTAATNVLTAALQTAKKHPEKMVEITSAINAANAVVENPSDQKSISNLYEQARHISERSWGKILGGAALALAGTALLVATFPIASIVFAAATPIPPVAIIASVATAMIGGAISGVFIGKGFSLFKEGMSRGPLSESIDKLASSAAKKTT